ncbi:TetR/AcrR family transcriptional regulator [Sphingomonas profundi]|uniref:TetR/AcrR family transcriptional regulator n=1 Tax=Alterirhizorhabdus profundi TaxID=2681549 RepID=UPI0018D00AD8|nr:TetR/AcrR family transcriptional regulator [Sphingomonas profundi]
MPERLARAAPASRRYASPLIAERRQRILDETKRLIGEVGLEGFTLRDLGERAGVSVTTVYNIFGDKEGVIAHALREFHAGIRLVLPASGANLAGFCRAIADTTAIVIENRSYSLALADLYFSRSLAPGLYAVIRGMPLQILSHWLWTAARDDLLRDTDTAAVETGFANLEWASIKDWGAGRIADGDLAAVRQRSFLTIALAAARPPLREAADGMLAAL